VQRLDGSYLINNAFPLICTASPLVESDHLPVTLEVSDNQDLPPAKSTMSATPNILASPLGEAFKTEGFDSLGEEQETQRSLEKVPREQERQGSTDDGNGLWKQEWGKRHLPDDSSDPAPHLTHLERQRKRVRIVSDEHRDVATRSSECVQMRSGEKKSEDQESWSRYGDMVPFGSYNGMHEASGVADAQGTYNVPKLEKGTEMIHTPDILTVEEAEIHAHLTSVDLTFGAPPASDSEPVSQRTRSRYADDDAAKIGHRFRPFPIQRDTMGGPVMSVDGPVYPLGAELYARGRIAAGFATVSRSVVARTGSMRGGTVNRGRGGMVRGGVSTRGRAVTRGCGEARGGCQTALGRIQRPSMRQVSLLLPSHSSSITGRQNKHNGHPQMLEMEQPPIDRGQKPLGPMDRHVHPQPIPQGQPSGFMPITVTAPPQSPTPRNLFQRQGNVTISARGPVPGTSYTFPDIERRIASDARIVSDPQHEGQHHHRKVFPVRPLQPSSSRVVMGISKSRMVPPPSLVTRGRVGCEGGYEYDMRTSMPPLADRTRGFRRPAMLPITAQVVDSESENGLQQPFPSPSQQPAMPRSTEEGVRPSFLTPRQRIAMLETNARLGESENGLQQPFPNPSQQPSFLTPRQRLAMLQTNARLGESESGPRLQRPNPPNDRRF